MSSSVSYGYRVREEQLRRQREHRAAQDALRAAERRHGELCGRAASLRAGWGDAIELPSEVRPASGELDTEALRAQLTGIEQSTAEAAKALDAQVRDARVAQIVRGLAVTGHGEAEPVRASAALSAQRNRRAVEVHHAADPEAAIARLAGRLDSSADDETLRRVTTATEAVRTASSESAQELAVNALRLEVQQSNEAASLRRHRDSELDALERRLDGFRGPDARSARELIVSARRADPGDAAPSAAVDSAVAAETARQARDYVAGAVADALAEMDCDVGGEFATVLAADGRALVKRASWDGFAIQVRCAGDPAELRLSLMRGEASRIDQEARDREVETEFCQAQAGLLDSLRHAGVDADQVRVIPVGEIPIQVVTNLPGESTPLRAAAPDHKQMQR